jgi:hypothetical protein
MSDLWIGEYEAIGDDYPADVQRLGQAEAEARVRRRLKGLGLDPAEIDEQVAGLVS